MPRFDPTLRAGTHGVTEADDQVLGIDDLIPRSDAGPDAEESAALAELFLGDTAAEPRIQAVHSQARQAPSPRRDTAPVLEGLILGHLPVLASAWVQQYARHVASELRRPVALLRLRASEAVLELISGSGMIHQPAQARTLGEALATAAREAAALLIRTEETTEPRLAELVGLDTLTLLSGADEAATVASYRTVKNLTARMDDDASRPEIRLAIMGATAAQAGDAAARIERAASAFLDRQVKVSACISKIGGGKSALLYKGPIPDSCVDTLRSLRSLFADRPTASPPLAVVDTAPPRPAPAPVPAAPASAAAPVAAKPVVSRIGHLPSGHADAATADAATASPSRLCDHIPGLTPSEVNCPYALGVEFAAGPDGRLHLLTHLDHDPSRALADLLTAAAWTKAHEGLLRRALAKGPRAGEWSPEPVLHAFTAHAPSMRHLGDAPIRLHLLMQIQAASQAVWFTTPLN